MDKRKSQLQDIIDTVSNKKEVIHVLEAGCGSISKVVFKQNTIITGIDISEKQLERNSIINKKILGDIQYYNLQTSCFDIIMCFDVLEHLPKPKLALLNFFKAVKDGGIIILALPNVMSLKGLITKLTPHWFHVLVYKYMYGWKNAGQDDVGPFKTCHRLSTSPGAVKKLAIKNGLVVEHFITSDAMKSWVGNEISKRSKVFYYAIEFIKWLLHLISFGKIGDSEYLIVLKMKVKDAF